MLDISRVIASGLGNKLKVRRLLKKSKIKYIEANTLEDAANKAVKALGN